MTDQLATIGGDAGPEEANPVTLFKSKTAGGAEVDFSALEVGATSAKQDIANSVLGTTVGAAVITDTNGTIQQYLRGLVVKVLALISSLTAGPLTDAGSLSVVPSTSQNPIFDHVNGTKSSVTVSATIITTPAGCQFLRISTDVDVFVNTAGNAAVDDGTSIRVIANTAEVIPVPPSTAIKALSSSGTATVRCTPLKVR